MSAFPGNVQPRRMGLTRSGSISCHRYCGSVARRKHGSICRENQQARSVRHADLVVPQPLNQFECNLVGYPSPILIHIRASVELNADDVIWNSYEYGIVEKNRNYIPIGNPRKKTLSLKGWPDLRAIVRVEKAQNQARVVAKDSLELRRPSTAQEVGLEVLVEEYVNVEQRELRRNLPRQHAVLASEGNCKVILSFPNGVAKSTVLS